MTRCLPLYKPLFRLQHEVRKQTGEMEVKEQSARYWPGSDTETFASEHKEVTVTKVSEEINDAYDYRIFSIIPRGEKEVSLFLLLRYCST